MFVVAGLEGTVLLLGERATLFAARLLKDGCSIGQGGADLGRKMGFGIRIMLLICIREVSAEAGGSGMRRGTKFNKGTCKRHLPIFKIYWGAVVEM